MFLLFFSLVSLHMILDDTRNHRRHRHPIPKPVITYDKLNITNHELKKFLRNELIEVLPAIDEQFESKFANRNVDFSNYRDLIFVSKRIRNINGKRKVEYTVTEKIIPKETISSTESTSTIMSIVYCFGIMLIFGVAYVFLIKALRKYKLVEQIRETLNK